MDAASKRIMWKILMETTAGRSILLTVKIPSIQYLPGTNFPQTHSMEEADALATRAAIISKRILAIGTTEFLRKKHGDVYHVHIVLESAPTSSAEEMQSVEQWAERTFSGVRFDSFGSYHGQIKFSVPAVHSVKLNRVDEEIQPVGGSGMVVRGGIRDLLSLLEDNKVKMGLKFYSVGATTLDQVFLNVVTENNVLEEGYAAAHPSEGRSWWCF
jgi:ATP-binding cassette, subfamily A (ABC1), member 3